jgi:D-alanyl-D-alanine carboxypeptidase
MKKLLRLLNSNFQIVNIAIALLIVGSIAFWYSSQPKLSQSSSSITPSPEKQITSLDQQSSSIDQSGNNIMIETKSISPDTSSTLSSEQNVNNPLSSNPPTVTPLPTKEEIQANLNLGHFPFSEAPHERLVGVSKYYDRVEYLDQEAAKAFQVMKADAQTQGIQLVLISGFRSISTQQQLFTKQIQKQGSKEVAAKLSAPPGHSEHHTGYAVDIGDGTQADKDLKFTFESTPAYNWLVNNAHRYGFELSFPRNNLQGVSFEPWHWRYVSSYRAEQIFGNARKARIMNNE